MNIDRVTAASLAPQRQPARDSAQRPAVGEHIALRYEGRDEHGVTLRRDHGGSLRMPAPGAWAQGLSVGDLVWMRVLATEPSLELEFIAPRPGTLGTAASPDELPAMRLDQAALRIHQWKLPSPVELAAAWRVILTSRHMDLGLQGLALLERQPLALPGPHTSTAAPAPQEQTEPGHWSFHLYAWGGMSVALRVAARSLWERRRPPRAPEEAQGIEVALSLPQGGGPITVQLLCVRGGLAMALIPRQPQVTPLLRELLPELAAALGRLGTPLVKVQLGTPLAPLPAGGLGYRPGPSSALLLHAVAEVVSGVTRHWPVPPNAGA